MTIGLVLYITINKYSNVRMAVKTCCIENCNSCSTRKEDNGVTYHKFPKDTALCDLWSNVTRHKPKDLPSYVCSRHFCKSDFQIYKDSKYVLKPGAIPSIFSWKMTDKMEKPVETITESKTAPEENENVSDILNSSKESEGENLDAIKRFIAKQDKDILERKANEGKENDSTPPETITKEEIEEVFNDNKVDIKTEDLQEETIAVASSVIDMILTESEDKIAKKKISKGLNKQNFNPGDKVGNGTMSLSVGSKVEAKDFCEFWYPAQIMEVDYDEMEVLVHYENPAKRHDEWISVSSPRLRPLGSESAPSTKPPTPTPEETSFEAPEPEPVKEEVKPEEKAKVTFVVGERCLARWRDNRRFIATVGVDLGDGKYEIVFDDGVKWVCTTTRMYKLKEPKREPLTVDTSVTSPGTSAPSPDYDPGPGNIPVAGTIANTAAYPAYHTHLFDPTRDYLGSKSERRAMKRKLNIKEIFNIGQKKKKVETPPKEKPKEVKKKETVRSKKAKTLSKEIVEVEIDVKAEIKKELPDAVASIIGTVSKDEDVKTEISEPNVTETAEVKQETDVDDSKMDVDDHYETAMMNSETLSAPESQDMKHEDDPALEEEARLESFEQPTDNKHAEVIDRIKEVITKLEGGINQEEKAEARDSPKRELRVEIKPEDIIPGVKEEPRNNDKKPKKDVAKVKKGKKLRLLQEKKVKKQVEKVKSELEEMKRQVEEMRLKMLEKTDELSKSRPTEMPESFLLPGEWCCKWVNGQPVGTVSEMECEAKLDYNNRPALPRRSVQVEDKRLPPGWTKHMVRRSVGHSAGKWDVVLISPQNKRFHTKTDMRLYFENNPDEALKEYEHALTDFGIHLKLSRRMGWYTTTPGGEQEAPVMVAAGTASTSSPLVKRTSLGLKKSKEKRKKIRMKLKVPKEYRYRPSGSDNDSSQPGTSANVEPEILEPNQPPLEDGYVYVGALKVQIIENLLRCPAEGCFKNFRNNTLLKMHMKHYHRELRKMLGATPKVLDLAYARTRPSATEMKRLKLEAHRNTIKVKLPKLPKREKTEIKDVKLELQVDQVKDEKLPRSHDSPKLRNALATKPVKRPKVLLPVRRLETEVDVKDEDVDIEDIATESMVEVPPVEPLDFETAISTHTVTKPLDSKRKGEKKRKSFASISKKTISEDEEWFAMNNSDVETRSSYPRSGTPDSKTLDQKLVSSESNEDQKDPNMYMFTETGERIKIVHMKREEIINCHCGFREEDGLMVQCELCLCWQHALCHNIQREADVPEKYTCSICLNPRRGRRSQRFLHDQDRLYEGLLPGAKPCETLRRSHELSGNLLRIEDALQALRVKCYVATKKDHPKLYLWAKDWETVELTAAQERLNSDYSDLNVMISSVGKENLPLRHDDIKDIPLDIKTPPSEDPEAERYSQRDSQLGSGALLSGLLSSPGGASLDLPISSAELERLAKCVQEQESQRVGVIAPQPEAAIENSACRERLLRHIQRCQAVIDSRLDSIEAQVAELESQDPSLEDDETAEYFPRTKHTVQMMMRDLNTMEELGLIT